MKRHIPLFFLVLWANPLSAADQPFFFQKGDRVIFIGDSITEQYQYSTVIELYLTTRFPEWNILFLNAGINGDTADGGAARFQKHILDEKPTAVTINFGMNDAGYGKFNEKANLLYVKRTAEMLEAANKAGIRVALLSPNAVDSRVDKRFELYLETQKRFYTPLKDIANKYHATHVDQYAATRKALEKMAHDDPAARKIRPFGDGFHTSPPGGLLMAHAILSGLHAPAVVSEIVIEGCKAEAVRCQVGKLEVGDEKITFSRTDEATPMPMQQDWVPLLPYVNDLKDLNYYGLKIKGLKQGSWSVSVDGKEIGRYTAAQLAEGMNLGDATKGSVFDFGRKVFAAINEKNEICKSRFRGTILSQNPDAKTIAALLEQIKRKQADIYKMFEPKEWSYEVKFVK